MNCAPLLRCFLQRQHFDGFAAGRQFKAKLVEQGLFQTVVLRIVLVPSEIKIETIGEAGVPLS